MSRVRVAVIGAGIVGASIARVLSRYENLEVHIVEREPDAAWGVTRANTAIIHGCYTEDPDRHPLRARLCVEGARLWRVWAEELGIPVEYPGALVMAFSSREVSVLRRLLDIGRRNGVPGLRLLDPEEAVSYTHLTLPTN